MEVAMQIPQGVETMMRTLVDHGFEAYLVGGCVRDALSGIAPHDYDITTDALPDEIIGIFGEEHCKYYGKAFGTVCVHFGEDEAEITTYRTEGDYTDSRHPGRVDFTKDVMDDLSRRDFTTNAICYSPITGLLDPFGGAEDLQKGILRAVGVPSDRFREDALRIMRGMRFYARFGLKPEPETDAAMRAAAPDLANISVERIFTELCGMLRGEHITQVLMDYPDILSVPIPEVAPCVGFEQHTRHHDFTVWEHIARTVGNIAPETELRLTMLLHDIAKPDCFSMDTDGGHFKGHAQLGAKYADAILRRLRCDNRMRERICLLIEWHRKTPDRLPLARRLYGLMGGELYGEFLQVLASDRLSKKRGEPESGSRLEKAAALYRQIEDEKLCCTVRELAVGGQDAMAAGLQGAQIRTKLEELLELVITGRAENTREALLPLLRGKL